MYTVHQVSGWEGRELMSDFDVFIAKDGETYRYLINNANFESFIKVIKVDAETGNTIPYAGAGFQIFRPDGSKVEMTFIYWGLFGRKDSGYAAVRFAARDESYGAFGDLLQRLHADAGMGRCAAHWYGKKTSQSGSTN